MDNKFFGFDNFDGYEQELIMSKMKDAKSVRISISLSHVSAIIDGEVLVDRPSYHAILTERYDSQVNISPVLSELLNA